VLPEVQDQSPRNSSGRPVRRIAALVSVILRGEAFPAASNLGGSESVFSFESRSAQPTRVRFASTKVSATPRSKVAHLFALKLIREREIETASPLAARWTDERTANPHRTD